MIDHRRGRKAVPRADRASHANFICGCKPTLRIQNFNDRSVVLLASLTIGTGCARSGIFRCYTAAPAGIHAGEFGWVLQRLSHRFTDALIGWVIAARYWDMGQQEGYW